MIFTETKPLLALENGEKIDLKIISLKIADKTDETKSYFVATIEQNKITQNNTGYFYKKTEIFELIYSKTVFAMTSNGVKNLLTKQQSILESKQKHLKKQINYYKQLIVLEELKE